MHRQRGRHHRCRRVVPRPNNEPVGIRLFDPHAPTDVFFTRSQRPVYGAWRLLRPAPTWSRGDGSEIFDLLGRYGEEPPPLWVDISFPGAGLCRDDQRCTAEEIVVVHLLKQVPQAIILRCGSSNGCNGYAGAGRCRSTEQPRSRLLWRNVGPA